MKESGVDLTVDGNEVSLEWWFWESQLEALAALASGEHDIVVYRGGYGSGKSVLGARWIIKTALETPNGRSLVLGQDFSKSQGTTFKVLFEQLPGDDTVDKEGERGDPENSPIVVGYNRNKRRLTLYNGHVIKLGSGDEWNREAGAEYNAIWGDEVAHYENVDLYKLNEMLISRQRTKQGPNISLWTSTGNGFNQFYDFVYRKVGPDGDDLPVKVHNVVADTRNNPFLNNPEKIARPFEGTGREEEALKGGFAAVEGLVYAEFSRRDNIITNTKADHLVSEWRCYGYDAGWNHPRCVVEIGRSPHDQYVVRDMFYEEETEIEDAVEWLSGRRLGRIYCEHVPDQARKFRAKGLRPVSADKTLDTGIEQVRKRFRTDSSGKSGILVAERCDDLIEELMSYKKQHVGKMGAKDHACDSLRYAIVTEETRPFNDKQTKLPSYSSRTA